MSCPITNLSEFFRDWSWTDLLYYGVRVSVIIMVYSFNVVMVGRPFAVLQ